MILKAEKKTHGKYGMSHSRSFPKRRVPSSLQSAALLARSLLFKFHLVGATERNGFFNFLVKDKWSFSLLIKDDVRLIEIYYICPDITN